MANYRFGDVQYNTIEYKTIQGMTLHYNIFSDVNQLKTHWQRPQVTATTTVQCGDEEVQRLTTIRGC